MCSRINYTPDENHSYIGRNMDWASETNPNLWVIPKGGVQDSCIAEELHVTNSTGDRTGEIIKNVPQYSWAVKYSSVVTCNMAGGNRNSISDGLNCQGLSVSRNSLRDSSKFPDAIQNSDNKPIAMSIWVKYFLDTCADAADAIVNMQHIYVITGISPTSEAKVKKVMNSHFIVTDKHGKSAVFEYVDGELEVSTNISKTVLNQKLNEKRIMQYNHYITHYPDRYMRTLTNEPKFSEQVENYKYWEEKHKTEQPPVSLPGSNKPSDRFVRGHYYVSELLAKEFTNGAPSKEEALANVFTIIGNLAQPATSVEDLEKPDLSQTQYSSLADQHALQYFYRSKFSPFFVWIDLQEEINRDSLKGLGKKNVALKIGNRVTKHAIDGSKDGTNVLLTYDGQYLSGKINQYLVEATKYEEYELTELVKS